MRLTAQPMIWAIRRCGLSATRAIPALETFSPNPIGCVPIWDRKPDHSPLAHFCFARKAEVFADAPPQGGSGNHQAGVPAHHCFAPTLTIRRILAGYAAGLCPDLPDFAAMWRCERRFEPGMDAMTRERKWAGWREAVARTLSRG